MLNKRIKILKDMEISQGDYVLYWMQHSQRISYNHALNHAITISNNIKKPLLVTFVINEEFPNSNMRHFYFMIEGLKEVEKGLKDLGIKFLILKGNPVNRVVETAKESSVVITDRGYTKVEKDWRERISNNLDKRFIQVETDVIIPVEELSNKEEYSAATIRRKINLILNDYLEELHMEAYMNKSIIDLESEVDISNVESIIKELNIDKGVSKSKIHIGGYSKAKENLNDFINNKLTDYNQFKNDPSKDILSNLSPYLHFGQISPLEVVLELREVAANVKDGFLDELIVRRELSYNFTTYNENYDNPACLPQWAINSLTTHSEDKREYNYSLEELELGKTHDRYWNAAQKEFVITGKMNGYMRMYWGKKVIEWTSTYELAYEYLLYLNDKYSLDGRDPNGYAGIAWVFGKHDRPWIERKIFGKIRYMNDKGLERKFDMIAYLNKVKLLEETNE